MWIPAHRGGRGEACRGTSQVYGKSRHTGEVGGEACRGTSQVYGKSRHTGEVGGEACRGTSQVNGKSRHTGEVGGKPVVAHHKCMVSSGVWCL